MPHSHAFRCHGPELRTARRRTVAVIGLILGAAVLLQAAPAGAELPLLARRHWAYATLASSAWLLHESWQAHDRAGDISAQIGATDAPAQIRSLETEKTRYDRRTQAMLGLSAGAVACAVYLWRTVDPQELPDPQMGAGAAALRGTRLCLEADAERGLVGLRLSRSF